MPRVYLVTIAISFLLGVYSTFIWLRQSLTQWDVAIIIGALAVIYVNEKHAMLEGLISYKRRRAIGLIVVVVLAFLMYLSLR